MSGGFLAKERKWGTQKMCGRVAVTPSCGASSQPDIRVGKRTHQSHHPVLCQSADVWTAP